LSLLSLPVPLTALTLSVQVEKGQHPLAGAPCDQVGMNRGATLMLSLVAGEQDCDRMQVAVGQSADPVGRVVRAGVA
jgi:hypothetical protein